MSALCQSQDRGEKKNRKKRKEGEGKRAYIDGSGDESRP